MSKKIIVEMADCVMGKNDDVLETLGIGSCVAICIYCKVRKIGGLAHIMLDYSNNNKVNPLRFSDKAIDMLLGELMFCGCLKSTLTAKIFGGASMFGNGLFDIGKKNVVAVKKRLKKEGIMIISSDVGGKKGRSVLFDIYNGSVTIKKARGSPSVY